MPGPIILVDGNSWSKSISLSGCGGNSFVKTVAYRNDLCFHQTTISDGAGDQQTHGLVGGDPRRSSKSTLVPQKPVVHQPKMQVGTNSSAIPQKDLKYQLIATLRLSPGTKFCRFSKS